MNERLFFKREKSGAGMGQRTIKQYDNKNKVISQKKRKNQQPRFVKTHTEYYIRCDREETNVCSTYSINHHV